ASVPFNVDRVTAAGKYLLIANDTLNRFQLACIEAASGKILWQRAEFQFLPGKDVVNVLAVQSDGEAGHLLVQLGAYYDISINLSNGALIAATQFAKEGRLDLAGSSAIIDGKVVQWFKPGRKPIARRPAKVKVEEDPNTVRVTGPWVQTQ